MRAGLLKENIEIVTPIIKKNKFGEQSQEWDSKYHTRARVIHNNGTRTNENGDIFYTSFITLEIRYYVPIDEYDRVKWNNKVYRILNIQSDNDHNKKIITIELIND